VESIGFTPIKKVVRDWPTDIFGEPEFLDFVGLENYLILSTEDLFRIKGTLLWSVELVVPVPGIEDISLAFLNDGERTAVEFDATVRPEFSLALTDPGISIRVRNDFFVPVSKNSEGKWIDEIDADGEVRPASIRFGGIGLSFDLDGNFDIDFPSGSPEIDIDAIRLGETGFVLEIEDLKPYFSKKQLPPPPGAAPGFQGVYIESLKLHFPEDVELDIAPDRLEFEHILLGTGGFGGTIRGVWDDVLSYNAADGILEGHGTGSISSFSFAIRSLEISFKQNTLTAGEVHGLILFPFFEVPVDCIVGFLNNGDFTVSISATQKLPAGFPEPTKKGAFFVFTKEDLLELQLKSIAFEKKDDNFSLAIVGSIQPLIASETISWPAFEVNPLTVDSEGNVSLPGGWLTFDEQLTLDFNSFAIEITKIGFGTEENLDKWVGFSGGINIVDGVPIRGGVE